MARHWCFALLLGVAMQRAQAGTLQIELINLWPSRPVRVELYGDDSSWAALRPTAQETVEARGARQVIRFKNLPPGRYAIVAEQRGPTVAWLKSSPLRLGSSGSSFGRRRPFAAAAIEVRDDPQVRVRLVETAP